MLRQPPRAAAIIGAVVGAASAAVGQWLAAVAAQDTAYVALPLLCIALAGLGLGSAAAIGGYAAALVVFGISAVLGRGTEVLLLESLRFATFLVGTPLVILLLRRTERDREVAVAARDIAEAARREIEADRRELEAARQAADTARRSAERDRGRLEEVAEAIPEPLVVYDDALQPTYANRAALRLFGPALGDLELAAWADRTNPRGEHGRALAPRDWPQARARRGATRQRLTLRSPAEQRDLMMDIEGTPIPGGGCLLLLRDIGPEEDELRRLSRFASFVAHELRNPLAVAKARMELARRDPGSVERVANHSLRALQSVEAAIGILERLELYSRADAGAVEAERARFAVHPAVESAIERLRIHGSEREVAVTVPDGVEVIGDRHLTEQAVTNLLVNADRYSHGGGPIRIEVVDGDPVILRVTDTGPGIADEVAERLFHERLAVGRGLGLGLYLVRASMEAMGGSVALEQRRPSAIFALRLPRASGSA